MQNLEWVLKFNESGLTPTIAKLNTLKNSVNSLTNNSLGSFSSKLSNVMGGFNRITGGLDGFSGGISRVSGGFSKLSSSMSMSTGLMAAGVVGIGAIISKVSSEIKDFTELAIDGISKKTTALRNWTRVLGDSAEAERRYFKLAQMSQKTEFTFEQLLGTADVLNKIPQIKETKDYNKWVGTIADVGASMPEERRNITVKRMTRGVDALYGQGYLSAGLLRNQFAPVGQSNIKDELVALTNLKRSEIDLAIREKRITADIGAKAIQQATIKRLGTSKTGEFAEGAAGSIGAMMANIKEAPENFIRAFDLEAMPGYQSLMKTFKGISNELDVFGGHSKIFREALQGIASFGMSIFSVVLDVVMNVANTVVDTWNGLTAIFDFGSKGMKETGIGVSNFFEDIKVIFNGIVDVAVPILTTVISFIFSGIKMIAHFVADIIRLIRIIVDGIKLTFYFFYDTIIVTFKHLGTFLSSFFKGLWTYIKGMFSLSDEQKKLGVKQMSDAASGLSGTEIFKDIMQRGIDRENQRTKDNQDDYIKKKMADGEYKGKNRPSPTADELGGGGGRGRGGGKDKDLGFNWTFKPNYSGSQAAIDMSQYLKPIAQATIQALSMPKTYQPGLATPTRPSGNDKVIPSITFVINESKDPKESINKIRYEIHRFFGQMSENPGPSVL